MYSLIHLATACVMLLHALLGCCVHHDHCCAAENAGSIASAADHAEHRDTCSHGPDYRQSDHRQSDHRQSDHRQSDTRAADEGCEGHPQPPTHGGPHQCDGGDCVFMLNGVSAFAVEMECLWLDSHRLAESEEAGTVKEFAGCELSEPAPPLSERLQAQYCIWLI